MKVYAIVEGHGEVVALPILLRRLIHECAGCYSIQVGEPIRRKQHEFLHQDLVEKAVRLAMLQPECDAILLLFDGEDHCPATLGPKVLEWARGVAGDKPCEVVVAYREYESWFLAAIESLRGHCNITCDAVAPTNPEGNRDAKGKLEDYMPAGSSYSETLHQVKLSARFDLASAYRGSRSFRKLTKATGEILTQLGQPLPPWPPTGW